MLVIGIGRLTKDPQMQVSGNGTNYINFDLAIRNKNKDQNGEYQTSFFTCKAFKGTAETIVRFCKKGSQLYITGDMAQRTYTNKENKQVTTYEVLVNEIMLLDSKKSVEEPKTEETHESAPAPSPKDDDLPF